MNLPENMSVTPMGFPLMAEAFFGCVAYATTQPKMLEAFESETGYKIQSLTRRSGLECLIDEASGYEKQVIGAWFDWVAINVFGTEDD